MTRMIWLRFDAFQDDLTDKTFHVYIRTDRVDAVAEGSKEDRAFVYAEGGLRWEIKGTAEHVTGAIAKSMSSPLVST